ncbi:hypothetical protein [Streptacidiphilus carbonis]|uniref:hypothetical protein n=1 Tax=Streptacidiphilus carbonis TaxID=105422 RepID=UPI000694121C
MAGTSSTEPPAGEAGPASRARGLTPGPLLVTENERLIEQLLRICAAAGAEPQLVCGAPPPRLLWESAPLVVVGDDVADRMAGLSRRPDVLLVGDDLDDVGVWRRAVVIGARQVVFLPDAESWLLDRIADAAEGVGVPALTVAVLGGRGGAGASTLACALAVTAAREGMRAVLIDGDPSGDPTGSVRSGDGASGLFSLVSGLRRQAMRSREVLPITARFQEYFC